MPFSVTSEQVSLAGQAGGWGYERLHLGPTAERLVRGRLEAGTGVQRPLHNDDLAARHGCQENTALSMTCCSRSVTSGWAVRLLHLTQYYRQDYQALVLSNLVYFLRTKFVVIKRKTSSRIRPLISWCKINYYEMTCFKLA